MGIADLAKNVNVSVTEGEITQNTPEPKTGKGTNTGKAAGTKPQTGNGSASGSTQQSSGGRGRGAGSSGQSTQTGSGSGSGGAQQITGGRGRGTGSSGQSTQTGSGSGSAQQITGGRVRDPGSSGQNTAGSAGQTGVSTVRKPGTLQGPQTPVFPVGGNSGSTGGTGAAQLTGGRQRGQTRRYGRIRRPHAGGFAGHLPELWGVDALCITVTVIALAMIITHWETVILEIARVLVRLASFALNIGILAALGFGLLMYVRSRSRRRRW